MDVRGECRYSVFMCYVWLDCMKRPRLADLVTHLVLAVLWIDWRSDGGDQHNYSEYSCTGVLVLP